MSGLNNLPKDVIERFINLSLRLEPERLYQDGERSRLEAEAEANEIYSQWSELEKTYQISVSQEEVEDIMWANF